MSGPWYDSRIELQSQSAIDLTIKSLPARWCVYLMCDTSGTPVQLLSVKNLRASVLRRLTENPDETLTRKIDYRAVVREIRYKRVDSAIESDLTYLQAAKEAFPDSYESLVPQRNVWFVHVDPDDGFPRWIRLDRPDLPCGWVFGPIREKGQAQKFIETIEDAFDLCRYHNVLIQAPSGLPCAYKDMRRCPAPCDGSVSMQQYRALVNWSVQTILDPAREIQQQTARMSAAASELKFELAGKIRQFIDQISSLRKSDWRFVRPLHDFRFLVVLPGARKKQARLFVLTPQSAFCCICLTGEPDPSILHIDSIESLVHPAVSVKFDASSHERLRIVVKHLFSTQSSGVFIHGDDLSYESLKSAYAKVIKRSPEIQETEAASEGLVVETKTDP